MAYDESLAERVRLAFGGTQGVTEQKMFGGLCLLVNGHMVCGIAENRFMARVGPERYADALTQPHVRPMDFTGRPMRGMIYVEADGTATVEAIRPWVEECLSFVQTLPPKKSTARSKSRKGAQK